ncbi:MAG: zf-HC2 domain-containing protein [Planctomycetes bacterium]|nr:zf-HC2 domain-containing protein [Planctomycetota bacterium]
MTDCQALRRSLSALLEDELPIERTLELEEHARVCEACGREWRRARALQQALLALPAPRIERLDLEHEVAAVLARLDEVRAPARGTPLLRLLPWAAAAGLAALVGLRFLRDEAPLSPPPVALEPEPAPGVPPEPTAPHEDPELDRARLDSARAQVARALLSCAPEFDSVLDEASAFTVEVDARMAPLAREGWPIAGLVQAAAGGADSQLAARALRWLGVHGESATRVRAALARTELAPAAVAALVDLGAPGVAELRRAPESPALRAMVLRQLTRTPHDALVPWIEDSLARGRGDVTERAALLDALADAGAVPVLLRLASRGTLGLDEALARVGRIPLAEVALGALIGSGRLEGIDEHVLLLAVAQAGTSGGWEWIERQAREGRFEADALLALSRGTPEALAALLRLRAGSGANAELLQRTLENVLRTAPDSAAALAPSASRAELVQLCALVCANPAPELVPALLVLAGSESLPEPDRRWTLLLAAEQGRTEDLPRLAALFARLRERTLQAAALIALHTLGGEPAVADALARRPLAVRNRVRALLDDPASANRNVSTLARLARAIENSLPAPQS